MRVLLPYYVSVVRVRPLMSLSTSIRMIVRSAGRQSETPELVSGIVYEFIRNLVLQKVVI